MGKKDPMGNSDLIKDMADAIKATAQEKKTSAYDTAATITRIEANGTAWVHIPGGVEETPVKLTISAKPGDTVQLRVGGGSAWLVGNQTAPPTDDTKANKAQETAEKAAGTATNYVADTNNGIFVHPKDNTEDGVQIRDKISILRSGESVAEYGDTVRIGKTDDAHLLIESDAVDIIRSGESVAEYGATARIGKAGAAHLLVKDDAVDIIRAGVSVAEYGAAARIGKANSAHFLIQDAKIAGYGNASSIYFETGNAGNTVQQTYAGDGSTQYFNVYMATSLTSVKVNGTTVSATLQNSSMVKTASAPANGSTVVITYKTSASAPYFTFGTRGSSTVGIGSSSFGNMNKAPGIYATAEGELTTAAGFASHAEGSESAAYGAHSHAEGRECETWGDDSHAGGNLSQARGAYTFAHGLGAKATTRGAMACGRYNFPTAVLFGVGYGNGDGSRLNAFSVGESGNCFIGKRLLSGSPSAAGTDYRAMFHTEDKTFSELSVPAGDRMSSLQTKSVAVTGYTPIAVTCYGMSGTNGYKCFPFVIAFSGNNILFNIYNTGSAAATATIRFTILYIASAAL